MCWQHPAADITGNQLLIETVFNVHTNYMSIVYGRGILFLYYMWTTDTCVYECVHVNIL